METGVSEHRIAGDDGYSFLGDVATENERAVKNGDMMETAINFHVVEGMCNSSPDSNLPGETNQSADEDVRSIMGERRSSKHHANGYIHDTMDINRNNVDDPLGSAFRNSVGTSSSESSSSIMRAVGHGTPPASLTDDERMRMLRYMRPSVFGVPVRHLTDTARPRSAADATISTRPKLTASGIMLNANGDTRQLHYRDSRVTCGQGQNKVRHYNGILAHDCWIEDDKSPRRSLSTAGTPRVQTNRCRSGSQGCCGHDSGNRTRSFTNSIAIGVNMGMLDILAGPTSEMSTCRVNKRRGQSAPRARRLKEK